MKAQRAYPMLAVLGTALAACAVPPSTPKTVSATAPTVTYAYADDRELVVATRKAEDYCRQYDAWPGISRITTKADGGKTVAFACDRSAPTAPVEISTRPNVAYTYRDERELVAATHKADRYCREFDAEARTTELTTNSDGTKTVSFECERRL